MPRFSRSFLCLPMKNLTEKFIEKFRVGTNASANLILNIQKGSTLNPCRSSRGTPVLYKVVTYNMTLVPVENTEEYEDTFLNQCNKP